MIFIPAVQPPEARPDASAWCFAFVGERLLLPLPEGSALLPGPLALFEPYAASSHYLGRLDGLGCWSLALAEPPPGWQAVALRAAMMQMDKVLASLAGRAAQVLEWDRAHRHCGVCGTPTLARSDERARACPNCGHVVYPRLSPAMMVLVRRGRELLLARSPHYSPGMYSALAGFVEAGESIEECVVREVAEEVGVQVGALRYFGSQSWPFPHSLMVAYTAEWTAGEIVPQAGEIEAAAWFGIDALPGIPPRISIAGNLIRDTVAAMRDG